MTATLAPLDPGASAPLEEALAPPDSIWRRAAASPMLLIGLAILALIVAMAVLAPVLSAYSPTAISGATLGRPSGQHLLGTDYPGRDIFAQLLYGARASLEAALVGGVVAMAGAIVLGLIPVLWSPLADRLANRTSIFMLALPGLPLIVLVGALAGNNQIVLLLTIGFGGIAYNARLLRSQALTLRDRGFLSAARGFGGGPGYVLRRHLLPAMGPLVVIGFVNWASISVLVQASLTFIGMGDANGVSWGLMMNRALGQQSLYSSPLWVWWVLPPGLAITVTLLGLTFVGVSLEPVFNPRWHRSS